MIARNVSINDLYAALDNVNIIYHDNIAFKNIDDKSGPRSKRIRFTLKVKSSKEAGASFNPIKLRRSPAACWHVHGDFFAQLLHINPDAVIITSLHGKCVIDINGGNWQDYNCGSRAFPYNASDACKCNA